MLPSFREKAKTQVPSYGKRLISYLKKYFLQVSFSGATTFIIMTFSITTLSIPTQPNFTQHYYTQHNDTKHNGTEHSNKKMRQSA
jgi:hypothetical protein